MKKPSVEKIGRVTSGSVLKHTGKDWAEWLFILDRAGAIHWVHKDITAFLKKRYKITPWWQQVVAIGFETATGKREEGRNLKGQYSVTATGTLSCEAKAVWKLIAGETSLWLPTLSTFRLKKGATYEAEGGVFGEVRTLKPGVRARLSWQETDWPKASVVMVHLVPRPNGKCILVIQHDGLSDGRRREEFRKIWKAAIARVKARATTRS